MTRPTRAVRAQRRTPRTFATLGGDDEALPQIAPADDGRAAPETAELDGAVEQAGIGCDQDWPRWLRQAHQPILAGRRCLCPSAKSRRLRQSAASASMKAIAGAVTRYTRACARVIRRRRRPQPRRSLWHLLPWLGHSVNKCDSDPVLVHRAAMQAFVDALVAAHEKLFYKNYYK